MKRRDAIRRGLSAAIIAGSSIASPAFGQAAYPNKPVRLVVPFTAGGFSDIVARLVSEHLASKWGVSVVIDNRPGAGSMLGADVVAKSPPDGYTLLLSSIVTHAIGPSLHKKLTFDPVSDLSPISLLVSTPNLLVINKDLPVNTVGELIALAKAKPRSLNIGSSGNGTTGHLSGALFAMMAGIELVNVQYRGGPQVFADLLANVVQMSFDNSIMYAPNVRAGTIRALACTSRRRSVLLPDVPTVDESGLPGFETGSWFAIAAPGGTPKEVITKINADIQTALASEVVREKLRGAEILGGTPEDYAKFAAAERVKWGKVVSEIGLQIE